MSHTKEKLILKALMILAVIALIALVLAWVHLTKQINQTNHEFLQSFTA
jgi:hypothetical protein